MDLPEAWCHSHCILQVGQIQLNLDTQEMAKGSRVTPLSPKLFQLLREFMSHAGSVLSRKELMKAIWDTDYLGDTRTLYVHVRLLREKIEDDPCSPAYLRTVRGMGYRFDAPE